MSEDKSHGISYFKRNYGFQRRELGKVLVIASLSILMVSIHSYYSLSAAEDRISEVDNSIDETLSLFQSTGFQRNLEGLRDLGATTTVGNIENVLNSVNKSSQTLGKTDKALEDLKERRKVYQWTSLIAFIGLVGGAVTYFV